MNNKGVFTFKDGTQITYESDPFSKNFVVNSIMIMNARQLKAFLKKSIDSRI